jgi:uncharacterized membrane protein AbrB (regulator of aidB expression)
MGDLFQPWHLLLIFIVGSVMGILTTALPLWLISQKAGLPKWPAILAVIPGVGIIVSYYIAFSPWKRPDA